MRNRGVLVKLILLVAIPVLAICGMGIYGIWNAWSTFASVKQVHGTAVDFRESALNIGDPLNQLRQLSLTMVMAPTRDLQKKLEREQSALTLEIDTAFEHWKGGEVDEAADAFNDLKSSWEHYKTLKDLTVTKVLSDYREEAFINAIDAEAEQFQLVKDNLATWMQAKISKADAVYEAAGQRYGTASWISAVLVVALAIVIGGFGSFAMRRIIGPIQTIRDAATRIATNTSTASLSSALDERIDVQSQDELGELARAFNQMVENLQAATERLSVEEKRIQAILNSTADGIITIDENGTIRSFNASAERLLNYRAGEAIGSAVTKMIPALHHEGRGSRSPRSFSKGEKGQVNGERQVDAVTRTGQSISMALRLSEMNYLGETLYIATMQDIRVRKEAEAERENLFRAIRDAVQRLAAASSQILTTTTQQATGAHEQAATVSQTVSTAQEISETAQQAVARANEVSESARRTGEIGIAGRQAIEDSIRAMDIVKEQVESIAENILSLAERAQMIGEITATVSDIAEQTNVLALNAAIEASRAGEHGKGFAVVASEVKSLAEQSKKATAQVRQILNEIQQATNKSVFSTGEGTKSVSEAGQIIAKAGETITTLTAALAESARSATQIAASANQQAIGVRQLNEG
ncbi:MAG: methyl-accepting chemotaxis protein, partial [Planctomycetota bacterium]